MEITICHWLNVETEVTLPNDKRRTKNRANKKFWEELIACFPFTVIVVSHMVTR
jgi:hypothetical protein